MSLSKNESIQFLEGPLGLSDPESKLQQDRVSFLDHVIVAFHRHQPFQTISNMSFRPDERKVPTWEQVKEDMFNRRGGLCFSLNYFASELLQSLGFSVFLAYGQTDLQKHNVHAVVIVQGLVHPGDTYLVDVGLGYATLRAVCLDFEIESPLYEDSFQPYKYVRIEDADASGSCYRKFARLHNRIRNNDPRFFPVIVDGWAHAYHFNLEPHSVARLREMFEIGIYRNITVPASRTFRIVHWVDGWATAIRNEDLLQEEEVEDKDANEGRIRRLRATPLAVDAQILAQVLKEFPQFDEELVRRAIAIWRTL